MSSTKITSENLAEWRRQFDQGESFRFHLCYSKSGMSCTAKAWHYNGRTLAKAGGCGYDRAGALIGQVLELLFADRLQTVPLETKVDGQVVSGFYGVYQYARNGEAPGTKHVDGACGVNSMQNIAAYIGVDVELFETGPNTSLVFFRPLKSQPWKGILVL